ncbi:MAG: NAD(P)-dependent alcohol dehydrogenase [Chitinophagaceae bacterium]|nr:NAD(P)-dependent alcohol dehydrogenase [Chitinophagaceae bacterium]
MKAVVYTNYGSPDQLHYTEVKKPVPKPNQVLIKVVASSINSWDGDLLRGKPFLVRMFGGLFKPKQKILGADIAGIAEAAGSDVKNFKPGDEVMGDIAGAGFGGFAEYAVAPEKLLCKKPKQLSFEQAAALPQAGLLAIQGLRYQKQLKEGDKVLINGAGGGAGPIALQYAKSLGAVVTCVDKEEKFEMLRSLGADDFIDYRKEDYTGNGKQYDYILDVTAHKRVADYKRALKPNGVFAMIGGSMGWLLFQMMLVQPLLSKYRKQKLGIMGYRVSTVALEELALLASEKNILPVIDSVFPLEETVQAFRHFEKGNFKGKIVISVKGI